MTNNLTEAVARVICEYQGCDDPTCTDSLELATTALAVVAEWLRERAAIADKITAEYTTAPSIFGAAYREAASIMEGKE